MNIVFYYHKKDIYKPKLQCIIYIQNNPIIKALTKILIYKLPSNL